MTETNPYLFEFDTVEFQTYGPVTRAGILRAVDVPAAMRLYGVIDGPVPYRRRRSDPFASRRVASTRRVLRSRRV